MRKYSRKNIKAAINIYTSCVKLNILFQNSSHIELFMLTPEQFNSPDSVSVEDVRCIDPVDSLATIQIHIIIHNA